MEQKKRERRSFARRVADLDAKIEKALARVRVLREKREVLVKTEQDKVKAAAAALDAAQVTVE